MNKPTMETLARRLDRVERENRHLKRAGGVALAERDQRLQRLIKLLAKEARLDPDDPL